MLDRTVFFRFPFGSTLVAAAVSLTLIGSTTSAHGAISGAWETFATENNTRAWAVYDYADGVDYYPQWSSDGEFSYFYHEGDEPLWFYTPPDEYSGNNPFIGDLAGEQIEKIRVDIYIHSLEDFDNTDCAVLTTGPAGRRYYYSRSFYREDFGGDGWWHLNYRLDETWFYYDEGWHPITPTQEMWENIEEIGFRFFLREGASQGYYSAIDDVVLVPHVTAPETELAVSEGNFSLSFTPPKGNICRIERLDTSDAPNFLWLPIEGYETIIGPENHVFTTPVSADRTGIFRVASDEYLTLIPEP